MKFSRVQVIIIAVMAVLIQGFGYYKIGQNTVNYLTKDDSAEETIVAEQTDPKNDSGPKPINQADNDSGEQDSNSPQDEGGGEDAAAEDSETPGDDSGGGDSGGSDGESDDENSGNDSEAEGANGGDDDEEPADPEPEPEPEPEIIMCVGDSVTAGKYPSYLQSKLNANYGSGKYTVVDKGVNGATADSLAASINSYLNSYDPDYVLLMIGGNDIAPATEETYLSIVSQTVGEVQQIVNKVKAHTNPDGSTPKLVLSAFIPNRRETPWGSCAIWYYNQQLAAGVSGEDKWFTTNWSDLYDEDAQEAKAQYMADDVHPNSSGNSVIATNWYYALSPILGESDKNQTNIIISFLHSLFSK